MRYKYVNRDGEESISLIFTTGDLMPVTISPAHEAWFKFRDALLNDPDTLSEEEARSLLVKYDKAARWVGRVSDSVEVTIYGVKVDGKFLDGPIAETLTKMATEGSDDDLVYVKSLAKFIEKTEQNPSIENSDQLYRWIINEGLTITPDGDFIGYKAVNRTSQEVPFDLDTKGHEVFWSSRDGGAVVNGLEVPGYVPNFVGAVVEMPRDKVDSDGNVHCSVGLHVGTFDYAYKTFGGSGSTSTTLLTKVNPADVVSVPNDYNFQKLRTCKYTVIREGVTSTHDERMYIDDEFAPISPLGISVDEEETIAKILERFRNVS